MTSAEGVRALVSVHDVMPQTLDRVQAVLDLLAQAGPPSTARTTPAAGADAGADAAGHRPPVTLLVVPGLDWDRAGIARLRAWQDQGLSLAGHGWTHRTVRWRGSRHRLHGLLISRRAAEHLALDGPAIARLIARCRDWFPAQGLAPPTLYVPPAWAMGALPRPALAALPFARYEVLTGLIPADGRGTVHLPLLGYEADTPLRALALGLWNRINRRLARTRGWVRIAIHPHDPWLRLGGALRRDLTAYRRWASYDDLAPCVSTTPSAAPPAP